MSNEELFEKIKQIFHEPNRMAIMSALCVAENGLTFSDLKEQCNLTDGNLNRHLKVLQEANSVDIIKKFVGAKPRTTVFITDNGLENFNDYLNALTDVLKKAKKSLKKEDESKSIFSEMQPAETSPRLSAKTYKLQTAKTHEFF